MSKFFATIDTGTNTILMLVAKVDDKGKIEIIRDEHSIARLGENVSKTGFISAEAIRRGVKIMENYRSICREINVCGISAVATSAVRDSGNRNEVASALSAALGSQVRIIDGETEAKYSFTGSVESDEASSLIDIGGGSTEFIFGEKGKINFRKSLNIGALKLTEKFSLADLPAPENISAAREFIFSQLSSIPKSILNGTVYAVAGTPVTVAAIYQNLTEFDYDKVHLFDLNRDIVKDVLTFIAGNPLDVTIQKYNINPKRADILIGGILILQTAMQYFDLKTVKANAKGLRYGLLKEMITNC